MIIKCPVTGVDLPIEVTIEDSRGNIYVYYGEQPFLETYLNMFKQEAPQEAVAIEMALHNHSDETVWVAAAPEHPPLWALAANATHYIVEKSSPGGIRV